MVHGDFIVTGTTGLPVIDVGLSPILRSMALKYNSLAISLRGLENSEEFGKICEEAGDIAIELASLMPSVEGEESWLTQAYRAFLSAANGQKTTIEDRLSYLERALSISGNLYALTSNLGYLEENIDIRTLLIGDYKDPQKKFEHHSANSSSLDTLVRINSEIEPANILTIAVIKRESDIGAAETSAKFKDYRDSEKLYEKAIKSSKEVAKITDSSRDTNIWYLTSRDAFEFARTSRKKSQFAIAMLSASLKLSQIAGDPELALDNVEVTMDYLEDAEKIHSKQKKLILASIRASLEFGYEFEEEREEIRNLYEDLQVINPKFVISGLF